MEGECLVVFKSNPENYAKEKSGAKPNTFRKIDPDDERFKLLRAGKATGIRIVNTESKEYFDRNNITDYTEWEGWSITSWKHEKC